MLCTAIRRAGILAATTALAGAAFAGAAAANPSYDKDPKKPGTETTVIGTGAPGGAGGPSQAQCLIPIGANVDANILNILPIASPDYTSQSISQCNSAGGAGGKGGSGFEH